MLGVVLEDITGRRRAERRQAFMLAFADALRPLGDPVAVQAVATRLLGEHLGANRVFYATIDADGDSGEIRADCVRDVPSGVGRYALSAFAPELVPSWRAGRTTVTVDVHTDPRYDAAKRAAFDSVSARSAIGVPLLKDGRLVALLGLNHASPRTWSDDEIALVEETAERTWDAVERARAEALRLAAEERLRTVVDAIEDYAIFGLDAMGQITDWTDAAQRVTGYTAEEAIGQPLGLFYTPEQLAAGLPEQDLETAARDGRVEREGWRIRKDGARIWINEVATAFRDPDGALGGFTKISRDLTERKRLEDERTEAHVRADAAREEAERALKVRDEFLAIVSHELRTPLAAITLWARLASQGRIPGREREALETIQRNADAQRLLIEDLLDASRFMSGNVTLATRPMALWPLVAEVVDAMRPAATERNVRLELRPPTDRVSAAVDPQRFAQALRALIDNAVRYSDAGSAVQIGVEADEVRARVVVTDTGRGISPDVLPHIFERFRRGGDGSGGLGLGLSIAHDIVRLHGGTLKAASPGRGAGATLTIELPVAAVARRSAPVRRPVRGALPRSVAWQAAGSSSRRMTGTRSRPCA